MCQWKGSGKVKISCCSCFCCGMIVPCKCTLCNPMAKGEEEGGASEEQDE